MATEFISTPVNKYVLTSEPFVITARTDKDKIEVRLECEVDDDVDTFYATTLYAFDGVVELADVGSLVEQYFRLKNKVRDLISIVFDDVSVSALFVYCENSVVVDFDPESRLLVAVPDQRVHQDSFVTIASIDQGSDAPFVIKALGHSKRDGRLAVRYKDEYRNMRDFQTAFYVPSILDWAINEPPEADSDEALSDVLYFVIEYAGIQKCCYIVPAHSYLSFSFRNIFNVLEYIDIVGVISAKTKASGDIAICNGVYSQYDRNITRSFDVQTEPVPASEVPLFEQFLASHRVELIIDSNEYPVIITDFTSEHSTADSSLTTFKFSWHFAGRRPLMFDSLVNGIMPVRKQVFNEIFSEEYD